VALGAVVCQAAAAASTPRAEVQINLCADPGEIVRALHLRSAGTPREVWYFETPAADVFARGVVFRLRLTEEGGDLTMKVADQDCRAVDPVVLREGGGKCEYDLHGADLRGAVSLTRKLGGATAKALVDGRLPLSDALSAAQVGYLRAKTSAWPLPAGITPRGPVWIDAYRPEGKKFGVEIWRLPSGQRYVEMSQKTAYADAWRLHARLQSELVRAGVAPCDDQSSQAGDKARNLAAGR
jgi:hypothetical protein